MEALENFKRLGQSSIANSNGKINKVMETETIYKKTKLMSGKGADEKLLFNFKQIFCVFVLAFIMINAKAQSPLLSEGFESGIPAGTWTIVDYDGSGTTWNGTTSNSHTGSRSACHSRDVSPQGGLLASPLITIPSTGYMLEFWSMNVGANHGAIKVYIMNNTLDTFFKIRHLLPDEISSIWQKIVIPLDHSLAGRSVRIGFYYEGTNTDDWYIDDIVVDNSGCSTIDAYRWKANFQTEKNCFSYLDYDWDGYSWIFDNDSVKSYMTDSVENWLISPLLTFGTGNYWLSFDVDPGSTTPSAYYVLTTNSNFTSIPQNIGGEYISSAKNVLVKLTATGNQYLVIVHLDGDYLKVSNIKIHDSAAVYDLRVLDIISPSSGDALTANEQVKVQLKNTGNRNIYETIKLDLSYDAGSGWTSIPTEYYTAGIGTSNTYTYTFQPTLDLSAYGSYDIKVVATINDDTIANNTFTKTVFNKACSARITSFPWIGDLTSPSIDCWEMIDQDHSGTSWVVGGGTARSTQSTGTVQNWLTTPQFVLNGKYTLVVKATNPSSSVAQGLKIFVSTPSSTGRTLGDFGLTADLDVTLQPNETKDIKVPLNYTRDIYIALMHYQGRDLIVEYVDVHSATLDVPTELYGYRTKDNSGTSTRGLVKFNSTSPDTLKVANAHDFSTNPNETMDAGEYVSGKYYYIRHNSSANTSHFVTISADTSDVWTDDLSPQLITYAGLDYIADMAYDFSTKTMYGVAYISSLANLVTIDTLTGSISVIGALGGNMITSGLACDINGQLYGLNSLGDFYSINKTNATTSYIDKVGYASTTYPQSMSFDHNTGRLFWAYADNLIEIDKTTGRGYYQGTFSDNASIVGLHAKLIVIEVVKKSPTEGATNAGIRASVSVDFNRNISVSNTSGITITGGGGNVTTVNATGKTLLINHTDFDYETEYTVTIPQGTINGYNQVISWKFKTMKQSSISTINGNENIIKIYPNPSNGDVNISVTDVSTVKLTDITGRTIATYNVDANSILNFNQAAGVYFVQIECKGKISTHKLVIIK